MSVRRIYERQLRVASGNALSIGADEVPRCFAVDFPPEGLITKLVVAQVDGTPVAFTVDVYNDLVVPVSEPGEPFGSSEAPTNSVPALAKVLPTQSGTAGVAMEMFNPSGYAFRNQRGSWTEPERKIYIEINPTNPTSDTVWEVAIACLPAIANW